MIRDKRFLIGYKLLFGLLGFSAIVTEMAVIAERGRFNAANFFSFFTVENNILTFIVFIISALYVAANQTPIWLDKARSAVTVYIAVVGIGFAVLLSGLENTILTAVPWDNVVLHYIVPMAVVFDLLIDRPKIKLQFKRSLVWLAYPIVYVVYSLIRGGIIHWYPYPFLNPTHTGYGNIVVVSLALLVLTLGLIWIVCKLSRDKVRIIKKKKGR